MAKQQDSDAALLFMIVVFGLRDLRISVKFYRVQVIMALFIIPRICFICNPLVGWD